MVVLDIAPGKVPEKVAKTDTLGLLLQQSKIQPIQTPETHVENAPLPLLQVNRRQLEDLLVLKVLAGADRDVVDLTLSEVGPRRSRSTDLTSSVVDGSNNLKVTSVLDELRALQDLTEPEAKRQPKCVTNAELDFETWADPAPFAEQIVALREGLYLEFDKLDSARAIKLAKLYAYFGFGVETIQVLDLLQVQSSELDRIRAIAMITDKTAESQPGAFSGQQRCNGDAAFWAVLTEQALHSDADLVAIEQAFGRLPKHLQQHFGPELAEILVRAQKLEASRRILRVTGRTLDAVQPSASLVKAQIAEAEGNEAETEALLKQTVETPDASNDAPLALARLIEKRWSDRASVSQNELELAAAYAVELRRSEQGPMMARGHTLALALTGEFDAALAMIDTAEQSSAWSRTRTQVLQLLSERADEITFLRYALSLSSSKEPLDADTVKSLSKRLSAHGFPMEAAAISGRQAGNSTNRVRSRFKAQTAILEGRPRKALLELSGDNTSDGMRLRAKALEQSEAFGEAADLMTQLGDLEAAERNQWRAGSVEQINPDSNSRFAKLSRLSEAVTRQAERQPEKPLADAALLLEDSEEVRNRIEKMQALLNAEVEN